MSLCSPQSGFANTEGLWDGRNGMEERIWEKIKYIATFKGVF